MSTRSKEHISFVRRLSTRFSFIKSKTEGEAQPQAKSGLPDNSQEKTIENNVGQPDHNGITVQDVRDASQTLRSTFGDPAKLLVQTTWDVAAVQSGVENLAKGMTVFMNTLDELSKVHPFISVAVLTFKAVYTLEMTRRENDKRVVALYLDMKDMMGVLQSLNGVDVTRVASDNSTIKSRLEILCQSTDKDMKDCSNTCDAFSHKKLLIKVLNAPVWSLRLAEFSKRFTTRRQEFEFALTIHSAVGIDLANRKLLDIDASNRQAQEKMDLILAAFDKLLSPEEKSLQNRVEKQGGVDAARNEDGFLESLLTDKAVSKDMENQHQAVSGKMKSELGAYTLKKLKDELSEDIDSVLERNMKTFERKFEVQKRQIKDLKKVMKRQGDRIIASITKGSHDRILDPDLHDVWKEMQWRGTVKTRHFINALRDYFIEKMAANKQALSKDGWPADSANNDEWVLDFLDVKYLQPISDAFDDDASGFISVSEANNFTSSRPKNWSLLRWLGYWAIGNNMSMKKRRDRILEILAEMFSLLPILHESNRAAAAAYLTFAWQAFYPPCRSLRSQGNYQELADKFQDYDDSELIRIQANLEGIKYDIDDLDTVRLVVGPGRIEKNYFPLAQLLLEHDLVKFHIAREQVLDDRELEDSMGSLIFLDDALRNRMNDVIYNASFSPQPVDLKAYLQRFAFGMLECIHDESILWSGESLKEFHYDDTLYETPRPIPEYNSKNALNYNLSKLLEPDTSGYKASEVLGPPIEYQESSGIPPILGGWNCCIYNKMDDGYVFRSVVHVEFAKRKQADNGGKIIVTSPGLTNANSATSEEVEFEYDGMSSLGIRVAYSGSWKQGEDGKIVVSLAVAPEKGRQEYWAGHYIESNNSITGIWGYDPPNVQEHAGNFFFTRLPSWFAVHRPSPGLIEKNRPRALWRFAIRWALSEVQRKLFSWKFMKARRDARNTFIELTTRYLSFGRLLGQDEMSSYLKLRRTLRISDIRYYMSLVNIRILQWVHKTRLCDVCKGFLMDVRITCLDCECTTEKFDAFDLCGHPNCLSESMTRFDLLTPHLPTHNLMKIRPFMSERSYGKYYRMSIAAIEKANNIFKSLEDNEEKDIGASQEPELPHAPIEVIPLDSDPSSLLLKIRPTCLKCGELVERPCWYCAECPYDIFLCWDCDGSEGVTEGPHNPQHVLVTCRTGARSAAQNLTVESRLESISGSLELRITQLQSRIDTLEAVLRTYLKEGGTSLPPIS